METHKWCESLLEMTSLAQDKYTYSLCANSFLLLILIFVDYKQEEPRREPNRR
jgi:hypothetical protein